jgi:hypothetical protein
MLPLALVAGGVLAASTRVRQDAPAEEFLFEGDLVCGDTYRILVASQAPRTDVESELRALGFDILLTTSDPTEPQATSFLATWERCESGVRPPRSFSFVRLEAVQPKKAQAEVPLGIFGRGLFAREERAIAMALHKDRDSKHLSGFAGTFFPDFPFAASLLNAKGVLSGRQARGVQKEKLHSVYQKMEHKLRASLVEKNVTPPLLSVFPEKELEALHPGVWSDVVKVLPESFVPRIEIWKAQEAVHGLGGDDKSRVASLAILSPEAEESSKALDSLGYSRLFVLAPGRSLVEKAASLSQLRRVDSDLEKVLWEGLRKSLDGVRDLRRVSRLVQKILREPQEMCSFSHLLAQKHEVSEPVARAAVAVLDELVEGVVIVNASRWRKLDPEGVLGTEPIPSSAFQLAFAGFRPEESGVVAPSRILEVAKEVQQSPEDAEFLERAKNAIQRQKWVDWYERLEQTHGLETPKLTGR